MLLSTCLPGWDLYDRFLALDIVTENTQDLDDLDRDLSDLCRCAQLTSNYSRCIHRPSPAVPGIYAVRTQGGAETLLSRLVHEATELRHRGQQDADVLQRAC